MAHRAPREEQGAGDKGADACDEPQQFSWVRLSLPRMQSVSPTYRRRWRHRGRKRFGSAFSTGHSPPSEPQPPGEGEPVGALTFSVWLSTQRSMVGPPYRTCRPGLM